MPSSVAQPVASNLHHLYNAHTLYMRSRDMISLFPFSDGRELLNIVPSDRPLDTVEFHATVISSRGIIDC